MSGPVQADGPISFSVPNTGEQFFIPLSELSYSADKVDASGWFTALGTAATPQVKQAATDWVGQLVSATQTYPGLTPATVQAVLGTSPGGGSAPGLAYAAPGGPAPVLPRNMTQAATASGGNWQVVLLVNDQTSNATALTLYTVGSGNGAGHTAVTVANANKAAGQFDLTVTWQFSATGLTAAAFQADPNFSYLLDVEPPTVGGAVGTPGAGTVVLTGGADPTPATAVVLGT